MSEHNNNNSTAVVEDDDDDFIIPSEVFEEPAGFRPPSPQPTTTEFDRDPACVEPGTPATLTVHLVGKHSLWGHWLWNAGKSMANYIDRNKSLVAGKTVLELGAAGALPTLVSAIDGARKVVSTDYPDIMLTKTITRCIEDNIPELLANGTVVVEGFIWGDDPTQLLSHLSPNREAKFDLILLADLIFNHNQHYNLLKSCHRMLAKGGKVFTTFTHHVVKWADRDMKFFETAVLPEFGFKFEKIYQERWQCMFPNDDGDVDVRSTVHGYMLWLEE